MSNNNELEMIALDSIIAMLKEVQKKLEDIEKRLPEKE